MDERGTLGARVGHVRLTVRNLAGNVFAVQDCVDLEEAFLRAGTWLIEGFVVEATRA